jgi:1,4-dihydroxy-2-naphthoate polyprenyltransferase
MNHPSLRKLDVWKLAARPKTLPAAISPVIVGIAIAVAAGGMRWLAAAAALVAALLLQIGANLANDYFDYFKGADAGERFGPLRVTQAGLATPAEMRRAMGAVFGLAALIGVYLAWVGGWPVLVIGVASILAALAYTGGPFPFGYYGLGEVFAFSFFGPVAVCGTVYVLTGQVSLLAWGVSIPLGLLVAAILVVNNLRDLESDQKVAKLTLAVRLGECGTRWEYALLLVGAYLAPPILILGGIAHLGLLLSWGSLLLVPNLLRQVFTHKGRPLNAALAGTGQLTLCYGALLALGILLLP